MGMLKEKTVDEKTKEELVDGIIEKQFITNCFTEIEQKEFINKIVKLM